MQPISPSRAAVFPPKEKAWDVTYSSRPLRALQGYHADLHTLLACALQQLHHLSVLGPLAVLAVHRDDVVALLQPGFLQGEKKKRGCTRFCSQMLQHEVCSLSYPPQQVPILQRHELWGGLGSALSRQPKPHHPNDLTAALLQGECSQAKDFFCSCQARHPARNKLPALRQEHI